ncbi:preprotein translocase subunit SecE [Patescibacteria group bacterium]|nr:preprotein translocase subunit SecE [Patescibacteria group bacterium]
MHAFTKYIKNSIAEMQKVIWPTRKQALELTVLIILVSIALGLTLAGLDWIWRNALKSLILRT